MRIRKLHEIPKDSITQITINKKEKMLGNNQKKSWKCQRQIQFHTLDPNKDLENNIRHVSRLFIDFRSAFDAIDRRINKD